MIVIGLDMYSKSWADYASRRSRVPELMRGIRNNSAQEKQILEDCRVDFLAATSISNRAEKLRDHLATIMRETETI